MELFVCSDDGMVTPADVWEVRETKGEPRRPPVRSRQQPPHHLTSSGPAAPLQWPRRPSGVAIAGGRERPPPPPAGNRAAPALAAPPPRARCRVAPALPSRRGPSPALTRPLAPGSGPPPALRPAPPHQQPRPLPVNTGKDIRGRQATSPSYSIIKTSDTRTAPNNDEVHVCITPHAGRVGLNDKRTDDSRRFSGFVLRVVGCRWRKQ